ncbi:putative flavin-binding monooxygenase-like [Lyophyllum shimeji]|uniref:Flavin-binding monooxygenase-like n=1 Tax=Lyophyllum shimeji TaxID=47721 RepID=A0A9P3PLT4_LYOSH|nr:putative flavin-binding monooxygenase-like [Lyophyllum shimeji]
MFTCLDSLNGHVEKVGVNRPATPCDEPWEELRKRQDDFVDQMPQVLVIGGGQAGLEVAARLKHLDVPTLVIERSARVGDSWRKRYDSLCLHDTVWYDHPPYMPFPSPWPVYPLRENLPISWKLTQRRSN